MGSSNDTNIFQKTHMYELEQLYVPLLKSNPLMVVMRFTFAPIMCHLIPKVPDYIKSKSQLNGALRHCCDAVMGGSNHMD